MTTTNSNPPLDPAALRKLAQDALELADKATGEGWFYWELEDRKGYAVDVMTRERWIAERVWDEADAALMAASRQLVPNLAAALLSALDRVNELEGVVLACMANESQVMGLYEDFDSGAFRVERGKPLRQQFSPEELEDLATEE